MEKNERHEQIMTILAEKKSTTPQYIAKELFTSYSSIRRDLEELEGIGLITRSYGKVELVGNHPTLITYPHRIEKNSNQKKIIASKAASLIKSGDTIFVDPSSSCSYFIRELANIKGITVITNNIEALYYLTQHNINVICSGGIQGEPNRYALVGSIAENTFKSIHADWCVFSTRSLTKDGKLYDIHYNETVVRNAMIENSDKRIYLCDSSKLNTISTYYQCSLNKVDYLSCDISVSKEIIKKYPNVNLI